MKRPINESMLSIDNILRKKYQIKRKWSYTFGCSGSTTMPLDLDKASIKTWKNNEYILVGPSKV